MAQGLHWEAFSKEESKKEINFPDAPSRGQGNPSVSNPAEYSGTYKAQDALRDRMITMNLGHYDQETEIKICQVRSSVPRQEAEKIVAIVRDFRQTRKDKNSPTVRAAIMIGKALKLCRARATASDKSFERACFDVLSSEMGVSINHPDQSKMKTLISSLIKKHC